MMDSFKPESRRIRHILAKDIYQTAKASKLIDKRVALCYEHIITVIAYAAEHGNFETWIRVDDLTVAEEIITLLESGDFYIKNSTENLEGGYKSYLVSWDHRSFLPTISGGRSR